MKLFVPYYRQKGPFCWYYCVKMIHDYHKRGFGVDPAARQEKINSRVATKEVGHCDAVTGALTLTIKGFEQLGQSAFNMSTDGAALEALLRARGPLFLPMWSEGHAVVIVGVEPMRSENAHLFDNEEWVVFVHDPGMDGGDDDPRGLKEIKQSLWDKDQTENLWAFQSKSGKNVFVPQNAPLVKQD